jgi:hypothetical protein
MVRLQLKRSECNANYECLGGCNGGLNVNGGHMSYGDSFKPAATWIKAQVDAFKGGKGAAA